MSRRPAATPPVFHCLSLPCFHCLSLPCFHCLSLSFTALISLSFTVFHCPAFTVFHCLSLPCRCPVAAFHRGSAVDVIKSRLMRDPSMYKGPLDCAAKTLAQGAATACAQTLSRREVRHACSRISKLVSTHALSCDQQNLFGLPLVRFFLWLCDKCPLQCQAGHKRSSGAGCRPTHGLAPRSSYRCRWSSNFGSHSECPRCDGGGGGGGEHRRCSRSAPKGSFNGLGSVPMTGCLSTVKFGRRLRLRELGAVVHTACVSSLLQQSPPRPIAASFPKPPQSTATNWCGTMTATWAQQSPHIGGEVQRSWRSPTFG